METEKQAERIVLLAVNARYAHTSFAVRCLKANLGPWRDVCSILEFDLKTSPDRIVEQLNGIKPGILGISVYIWNVNTVRKVLEKLREQPDCPLIILGGPEAGFLPENHPINDLADFIVRGEGENAFRALCDRFLRKKPQNWPEKRQKLKNKAVLMVCEPENLGRMVLPYAEYSDEDLKNRIIYVESSRGCPFACEYCISALEKGVRYIDRKRLFDAFNDLFDRGARQFRFLDRSFNLNDRHAAEILRYFREKCVKDLDLHFELIPDRLEPLLRGEIELFPPGMLHFEVGIQTYNPEVAARINRRCDFDAADENLRFLTKNGVKVHADLIAGLPGEDFESFSTGFNRLLAAKPAEIQVGVLKKLFGTPIERHSDDFGMIYSPEPPYEVLQTAAMTRVELDRIKRFAAFWERLYNRGNFPRFMHALIDEAPSPFDRFLSLSEHLFRVFQRTYGIPMLEMIREMMDFAVHDGGMCGKYVRRILLDDYLQDGNRIKPPKFLKQD